MGVGLAGAIENFAKTLAVAAPPGSLGQHAAGPGKLIMFTFMEGNVNTTLFWLCTFDFGCKSYVLLGPHVLVLWFNRQGAT